VAADRMAQLLNERLKAFDYKLRELAAPGSLERHKPSDRGTWSRVQFQQREHARIDATVISYRGAGLRGCRPQDSTSGFPPWLLPARD